MRRLVEVHSQRLTLQEIVLFGGIYWYGVVIMFIVSMQKRGLFWSVVWNMNFIFPNSWDDDPISEVGINNHYPTIKNSDFPVRYVNVYQAGYDDLFVLKDW